MENLSMFFWADKFKYVLLFHHKHRTLQYGEFKMYFARNL